MPALFSADAFASSSVLPHRNLRVRVDDGRDNVEVDVARLTRELFDARDALLLRLVREHGPLDDVSDGVHAGFVGGVGVHVHP